MLGLGKGISEKTSKGLNKAVILLFIISLGGIVFSAGIAVGQDDPSEPLNFFGEIEEADGTPAPEGVEVFAIIGGDVKDSIEVDPAGQYGGEGAFEDKLTVNTGAGDAVEFRAFNETGPEALESPFDISDADDPVELDLTFSDGTFPDTDPSEFAVSLDDAPETVEAGEPITVEYTITNSGGEPGVQDIEFSIDGELQDTETGVELDVGEEFSDTFTYETDSDDVPEATAEVASDDDADSAVVTVEEESIELADISLTLGEDTLDEGETTQATVVATYDDGSSQDVTDEATIESDNPEIATVSDGTVTAESDGVVAISAEFTDEGVTELDRTELTVEPSGDEDFAVSIDNVPETVGEGETIAVEYTVTNDGDEPGTQDIILSIDGGSQDVETAVDLGAGGTFSDTFTYQTDGDDVPEITVEVASDDDADSATVTVEEETIELVDISLALEAETLEVGEIAQATVTATYNDGSSQDVTDEATIESDNPDVATVSEGVVTAEGDGVVTISAEFTDDGVTESDSAELGVEPPEAERFAVDIDTAPEVVEEGETVEIEYTITNEGGEPGTQDIELFVDEDREDIEPDIELGVGETFSNTFEYETEDDDVPEITVRVGSADDDASAVVAVQREDAELADVTISLGETQVVVGETTQATVTATYDDGSSQDVTNEATIESDNPDVATVSGTTVTAESAGEVTLSAEFSDGGVTRADSTDLTVDSLDTEEFTVNIDDVPEMVEEGDTVTVEYTVANEGDRPGTQDIELVIDGTQETVELGVELGPGDTFSGTFTYVVGGDDIPELTLEVASDDDVDSADIAVEEESTELVDLSIAVAEGAIEAGETTAVTVTATYDDGSSQDVTGEVTVESDSPDVATVSGTTVTAEAEGDATLSVEFSDHGVTMSGSTELTVEPSDDENGADDSDDGFGPGLGVISALVALTVALFVLRRRT